MKILTKKQLKAIKAGDYDELIRTIEALLDTYSEDKFDNGYRSCIDDIGVHSYRIATVLGFDEEQRREVANIIENYLQKNFLQKTIKK